VMFALIVISCCQMSYVHAADEKLENEKKALTPLKLFVGDWKGGGSIKGNSIGDAWVEESTWSYDFKGGHAALVFSCPTGRFFTGGRLEPEKSGSFKFTGTLPNNKGKEELSGEFNPDGDLVLTNANPTDGRPARLTMSVVAKGKRLVLMYQKKERKDLYSPIAEVGFTLKGSGFGKNVDAKECCITGGTAKSSVVYKGETYYFCCGGCKDAFDENPEKEIAAYKKRKADEKKPN
jgi:YHS domain-containing protein